MTTRHISSKAAGVKARGCAIRPGALDEPALCGARLIPGAFVDLNAGRAGVHYADTVPAMRHWASEYCPACAAAVRKLPE